jgi:hypothetical protein
MQVTNGKVIASGQSELAVAGNVVNQISRTDYRASEVPHTTSKLIQPDMQ